MDRCSSIEVMVLTVEEGLSVLVSEPGLVTVVVKVLVLRGVVLRDPRVSRFRGVSWSFTHTY